MEYNFWTKHFLFFFFFLTFQIATLFEEVARLRNAIATLQENHNIQVRRFEERLEAKRQHILRLESRIEKQSDYDDVKKENR
jgi:homeobox protein cut-like